MSNSTVICSVYAMEQCNTECFTVYMVHYQKDQNLQLIFEVQFTLTVWVCCCCGKNICVQS